MDYRRSSARCEDAWYFVSVYHLHASSLSRHPSRIFEAHDGGEEDCLRLLVGNLPGSINGPAKSTTASSSLPLSPHYARVLADLARDRGFDGYLLNFECPLRGGIEQTRTLAAWITLLQNEVLAKVGSHGETIWFVSRNAVLETMPESPLNRYDSVIFTGQLAWQDRLNSLNLPFFLSSTSIFTNYTVSPQSYSSHSHY
jgi:mannosyl-glycoprotein endo-beta-N-acetylglucosaminidase